VFGRLNVELADLGGHLFEAVVLLEIAARRSLALLFVELLARLVAFECS